MDFPNQQPANPGAPSTPQPAAPKPAQPQAAPAPAPAPAPTSGPAPSAPAGPGAGPMPGPAMGGVSAPKATAMPPTAQQMGAAPAGSNQVHAMPQKFLDPAAAGGSGTGDSKGGGSGKKKSKAIAIVLVVVIVLAIAGIVAGVAYYILQGLPQPETEQPVVNEQPLVTNEDQNDNVNEVVNVNADDENANANENANENDNVNADDENANANENTNANENANSNANANTNSNVNDSSTVPVTATPGDDEDGDELSDEEEKLYGTKANLPDTDSDGFTDGDELLAGYDPANAGAALLDNTDAAAQYSDATYGFNIVYPAQWAADPVPEAGVREVLFTPTTLDNAGQFVAVTVEENVAGLTAESYYAEQAGVDPDSLTAVTTANGDEGVMAVNGYSAYFADDDYIYIVSYQFGTSRVVHFTTTFTMMINTLELTGATTSAVEEEAEGDADTNANVNSNANTNLNADSVN